MRKMLLGLAIISILVLTAACRDGQVQREEIAQSERPEINIPQSTPQSTNGNGEVQLNNPVMVTEGNTDLNGDGTKETIQVWLIEGKEVTYTDPGPLMGTYLNGQFDVVATGNDGKEVARLGLNDAFDGGEMDFLKEPRFSIEFDDYNGDGHPDFTIGQWAGSNGNIYALITIGPDGFHVLEKNIYSADHVASIRYRKIGKDAFVNQYYDQLKGSYMEVIRHWKDGTFLADPAVKAIEIDPAVGENG